MHSELPPTNQECESPSQLNPRGSQDSDQNHPNNLSARAAKNQARKLPDGINTDHIIEGSKRERKSVKPPEIAEVKPRQVNKKPPYKPSEQLQAIQQKCKQQIELLEKLIGLGYPVIQLCQQSVSELQEKYLCAADDATREKLACQLIQLSAECYIGDGEAFPTIREKVISLLKLEWDEEKWTEQLKSFVEVPKGQLFRVEATEFDYARLYALIEKPLPMELKEYQHGCQSNYIVQGKQKKENLKGLLDLDEMQNVRTLRKYLCDIRGKLQVFERLHKQISELKHPEKEQELIQKYESAEDEYRECKNQLLKLKEKKEVKLPKPPKEKPPKEAKKVKVDHEQEDMKENQEAKDSNENKEQKELKDPASGDEGQEQPTDKKFGDKSAKKKQKKEEKVQKKEEKTQKNTLMNYSLKKAPEREFRQIEPREQQLEGEKMQVEEPPAELLTAPKSPPKGNEKKANKLENYFIRREPKVLSNPTQAYQPKCLSREEMNSLEQHLQAKEIKPEVSLADYNKRQIPVTKPLQTTALNCRERKVHIYITDSWKEYQGFHFTQRSSIISPRNPFKRDETVVNYDIDSDEEVEELNAQNMSSQEEMSQDSDDTDERQSLQQFVIADDQFCEDDNVDKEEILNKRFLVTENGNNNPYQIVPGDEQLEKFSCMILNNNSLKVKLAAKEKKKPKNAAQKKARAQQAQETAQQAQNISTYLQPQLPLQKNQMPEEAQGKQESLLIGNENHNQDQPSQNKS